MDKDTAFTPGGPRSREKVHMIIPKADRAMPPGGPRHRSRVRRIRPGDQAQLTAERGNRLRQRDLPGPPDQANWITYAGWMNMTGNPITKLTTAWTVPPTPATQASQLLYFFNGIEPADGQVIVQPVLQWGDSGADEDGQNRTGSFWTVASWIVGGPNDTATHTPHIRVNTGDVLVGVITLASQSAAGFTYTCEFQGLPGTSFTTPPISELVWCVETLEAYENQDGRVPPYDLDSEAEYPAGQVAFRDIAVVTIGPGPGGSWQRQNIVTQYGENTALTVNSTTNGEVVISL